MSLAGRGHLRPARQSPHPDRGGIKVTEPLRTRLRPRAARRCRPSRRRPANRTASALQTSLNRPGTRTPIRSRRPSGSPSHAPTQTRRTRRHRDHPRRRIPHPRPV